MTRGSTVSPHAELDRVRAWLEETIAERMEPLLHCANALTHRIAEVPPVDSPALVAADVEKLTPTLVRIIDELPSTIGAGFIAAPDVVDSAARYMLWIQRRNGAVRRLRLNFDTTDLDAYDYVNMDWYVHTRDSGLPSLTGPYLDYSGSDALVLTAAAPVLAGREFLGVIAIDVMAQAAEDLIRSHLCDVPGDVVLVNRDRTVVATNSVRWMPGERLHRMPDEEPERYRSIVPVGTWTEWRLAVARAGD